MNGCQAGGRSECMPSILKSIPLLLPVTVTGSVLNVCKKFHKPLGCLEVRNNVIPLDVILRSYTRQPCRA
ncbi:hypothetical protein GQ457_14G004880 [Hibiscus cannabinus]